jgi:hypothetical protein
MRALSVVNATDWLFVTLTVCGALMVPVLTLPKFKFRLIGEKVTAFAPVPVRVTACGLDVALSFIVSRKGPCLSAQLIEQCLSILHDAGIEALCEPVVNFAQRPATRNGCGARL